MNVKQILIATAAVALTPFTAQANGASSQRFGEAFPIESVQIEAGTLTRADVREELLSLDHRGQNFGQVFPYEAKDPMTVRLLAEVRRDARNAPRMYGEANGECSHN